MREHVTHLRFTETPLGVPVLRPLPTIRRDRGVILPRGGATIVRLIDENAPVLPGRPAWGAQVVGTALCHPNDVYCRKIGRELARDRAYASAVLVAGNVPKKSSVELAALLAKLEDEQFERQIRRLNAILADNGFNLYAPAARHRQITAELQTWTERREQARRLRIGQPAEETVR